MRQKFIITLLLVFTFTHQASAQNKDAQIQEATAVYARILKSEEAARYLVLMIAAYTEESPWQLSTTLILGQRVLVAGLPSNLVVSSLESCGDMAVALGSNEEGFAELVLRMVALRQSSNKDNYIHLGVLDHNGVPVYKMLGEAVGKAPETIKLYSLQGKIDSKTAFQTLIVWFEREYKGLAAKVAKERKQ